MAPHPRRPARAAELQGRRGECAVLDRLIEAVRAGESRALVLCGEAGAGKTALLDYLAGHAPGCRVVRAAGVQSEMELAFAAVHQLCAPMLGHLERLPGPQREALTPDLKRYRAPILGLPSRWTRQDKREGQCERSPSYQGLPRHGDLLALHVSTQVGNSPSLIRSL